jgi:hypothetical protein
MLKFLIVGEGEIDIKVLPIFIKKIISGNPSCKPKKAGNKTKVLQKFPKWLNAFCNRGIDKTIVVVDQDDDCIKDIFLKMKNNIDGEKHDFTVKFHIIEKEIEAWLLADEIAISSVVNKNINRIAGNLEDIKKAKEKLQQILSGANKVYTTELASKIANKVNIDTIGNRCPGFKRFQQSVLDC